MQNCTQGSLLLGAISYGKLSFGQQEEGKNPLKNPVSYQLSYIVPPNKVEKHSVMYFFSLFCFICNGLRQFAIFLGDTYVTSDVILIILFPNSYPLSFIKYLWQLDEDKGKGSSSTGTKTVFERLEEEVSVVQQLNVLMWYGCIITLCQVINLFAYSIPIVVKSCIVCVPLLFFRFCIYHNNQINWNTYLYMQRNIENLFNHSALNAANWALYMICLRNWFSIAFPEVGIKQISIN